MLYPFMQFDEQGQLVSIQQPIEISDADRKRIYSYLWRIQKNREFKLQRYGLIEEKIQALLKSMDQLLQET